MSQDEVDHPLGRKRIEKSKTKPTTQTRRTVTKSKTEPTTQTRRTVTFGYADIRTPNKKYTKSSPDDDDNDNDNDNDKWKDQRRRLDSFENEREMNKLLGGPKTKIQRLKDMRRMRRAALRESPPARRILQDPKGAWVLIVVLIILTLLGVHYFCDTWIEALTLLVFVTVVTFATATIQ